MTRMVALLRAVNVGGRKLPMADLRSYCDQLGWNDVATYIQSGNVVFSGEGSAADFEEKLESAIERETKLQVPVIVRTAEQWSDYPKRMPFAEAARDEPNRLLLVLSKSPPAKNAGELLQKRAVASEKVAQVGDAIWIHYPKGVGSSKLSPMIIDRAIGSPATARNFRTVLKLQEMLEQ